MVGKMPVTPEERKQFAQLLRQYRYENTMSQWCLARAIDVHERTIVAWEAGDSLPNEENMKKLEGVFRKALVLANETPTEKPLLQTATMDELLKEIQRRGYHVTITSKN